MRLTAAFLLASACAIFPATAQQQDGPTIVVTGKSLADTEKALKDCIARHCPPDEDIAATLAHAENQFVGGKYKDARKTLLASRSRNRRFARDYPVPVGDLLRANARVAGHLGEGRAEKLGLIDSLDALREGLPKDDIRILAQRVEVADVLAAQGHFDAANDMYKSVSRDAQRLGYHRLQAAAALRGAWLWSHAAKGDSDYVRRAVVALDEVIGNPDPGFRPFGQAARVMKAQLLSRSGDRGAIDTLIAEFMRTPPGTKPVLIYSEPIDIEKLGTDFGADMMTVGGADKTPVLYGGGFTRRAQAPDENQWVDIVFWVRPDGKTGDIEVARRSARGERDWERVVTDQIKTRRYAPLKMAADDPGILRVERYTFTANFADMMDESGTRMRRRQVTPKIEMLDLSQPGTAARAAAADKG